MLITPSGKKTKSKSTGASPPKESPLKATSPTPVEIQEKIGPSIVEVDEASSSILDSEPLSKIVAQEPVPSSTIKGTKEIDTSKSQPNVILKKTSHPVATIVVTEVPTSEGTQGGETARIFYIDISTQAAAAHSISKDDTSSINEPL